MAALPPLPPPPLPPPLPPLPLPPPLPLLVELLVKVDRARGRAPEEVGAAPCFWGLGDGAEPRRATGVCIWCCPCCPWCSWRPPCWWWSDEGTMCAEAGGCGEPESDSSYKKYNDINFIYLHIFHYFRQFIAIYVHIYCSIFRTCSGSA